MARRNDDDKEQRQYRAILEELLKQPENKFCADCNTAAPRWASAKLGVFLCMKCSGIHRSLGTHISFVRSVTLDKWKAHEVDMMQRMGNARSRAIYEAMLPPQYMRPTNDQHALERFIRQKYEQKRFYKEPEDGNVGQVTPSNGVQQRESQQSRSAQHKQASRPVDYNQGNSAPVQRAAPVADLLGSFSAQPMQQQVQQTPKPVANDDEFADFVSSSAPPSNASTSLASAFTPSAEQTRSNILNLFDEPPPQMAPPPGYGAPYGYGSPFLSPCFSPESLRAPPPHAYAQPPYGYQGYPPPQGFAPSQGYPPQQQPYGYPPSSY